VQEGTEECVQVGKSVSRIKVLLSILDCARPSLTVSSPLKICACSFIVADHCSSLDLYERVRVAEKCLLSCRLDH
jgi:hypothetical protein